MNQHVKISVASVAALLAVILAGIVFFQQPAKSASSVPGTDVLMAATEGATAEAEKPFPTPTLTPIPEDETLAGYGANLATPIP